MGWRDRLNVHDTIRGQSQVVFGPDPGFVDVVVAFVSPWTRRWRVVQHNRGRPGISTAEDRRPNRRRRNKSQCRQVGAGGELRSV